LIGAGRQGYASGTQENRVGSGNGNELEDNGYNEDESLRYGDAALAN